MSLKGSNSYCGPAALAAIFGRGMCTDEAAALIRKRSGQRAVKGAPEFVLKAVIREHVGGLARRPELIGKPAWQIAKGCPLTLLVVKTDGYFSEHFVVVRRGKLIDSFSREWVLASKHRWRNARVLQAIEITKAPRLIKPKPAKKQKDTPARRQRNARIYACDLALKLSRKMKRSDRDLTQWLRRVEQLISIAQKAAKTRKEFAAEMQAAKKQARAQRQRARQVEADAVLVVQAGRRVIDEIRDTEIGRHEDAGCLDEGDIVAAIDRSPAGKICFCSVEEVEDALWALDSGTAFLNDQTHLRHHIHSIVEALDRWVRQRRSQSAATNLSSAFCNNANQKSL
jgi:hypothetical protein